VANTGGVKMGMVNTVEPWVIEFLKQLRRENDAVEPEFLRERIQMPVRVWPGERESDSGEPAPEAEGSGRSAEDHLGC